MKTIQDFQKKKSSQTPISVVTCYDYTFARLLNQTHVDCILVGDSAAMTMHGHKTTLPATVDMMAYHVAAVAKGAPDKFVIGDMPFLSYRKGLKATMQAVQTLMQAGAQAIKLEGGLGNEETVSYIVSSGVPVIGHIGLTPQSFHGLGGFCVQGKDQQGAEKISKEALALEKAGCFALVLECVPMKLAQSISNSLTIPTIGIGAGPYTDGQVLILQDMLGLNKEFEAKFVKQYLSGFELITEAINNYDQEVKARVFPKKIHSYGTKQKEALSLESASWSQ